MDRTRRRDAADVPGRGAVGVLQRLLPVRDQDRGGEDQRRDRRGLAGRGPPPTPGTRGPPRPTPGRPATCGKKGGPASRRARPRAWPANTGTARPTEPISAMQYRQRGIPWFDYYAADLKAVDGAGILQRLKSVVEMGNAKRETLIPENDPIVVDRVVQLRRGLKRSEVREGAF